MELRPAAKIPDCFVEAARASGRPDLFGPYSRIGERQPAVEARLAQAVEMLLVRHPSFKDVREDKATADVHLEAAHA